VQFWFSARSSDLSPLNFYFWGYIKQKVHVEELTTAENMKNRIREACTNINADVLQKVWDNFRRRLDVCIQGVPFNKLNVTFKQLFKVKLMTPSYVPLKAIQLLSETFFSKIKNKNYLGWDIKMGHPV
ncbi:hypothetical protein ALC60_11531, partial [Trachymyrmex zeteki]